MGKSTSRDHLANVPATPPTLAQAGTLAALSLAGTSQTHGQSSISGEITWLVVRYEEKDTVKALGAQWNDQAKKWYVPPHVHLGPFTKWIELARVDLNVPYADRTEAKALGARWDAEASTWYATSNLDAMAKWRPASS